MNIHIQTGSSVPIYRQIVDQICRAAMAGTLKPDDQLPSVRELAEQLVLNPNTVAKAYAELTRDGFAEARQGRGVFIVERRRVYSDAERRRRLDAAIDTFLNEALFLDFDADDVRQAVERRLKSLNKPARHP